LIIRHLKALLYRNRCERDILIPMLEKLTEGERLALWRLFHAIESEAKAKGLRDPLRRF
jgi:hypothetical protein